MQKSPIHQTPPPVPPKPKNAMVPRQETEPVVIVQHLMQPISPTQPYLFVQQMPVHQEDEDSHAPPPTYGSPDAADIANMSKMTDSLRASVLELAKNFQAFQHETKRAIDDRKTHTVECCSSIVHAIEKITVQLAGEIKTREMFTTHLSALKRETESAADAIAKLVKERDGFYNSLRELKREAANHLNELTRRINALETHASDKTKLAKVGVASPTEKTNEQTDPWLAAFSQLPKPEKSTRQKKIDNDIRTFSVRLRVRNAVVCLIV